jgi:hypothetical protein
MVLADCYINMGCGASTKPMIGLYVNEANPPCELVAGEAADMPEFFPPSGLITRPVYGSMTESSSSSID